MDRNDNPKQAKAETDWAAQQTRNDEMEMKLGKQKAAEDGVELTKNDKIEANEAPEHPQGVTESPQEKTSIENAVRHAREMPSMPAPTYAYHCCFSVAVQGPPLVRDMVLTLSELITEANYQALKAKISESQGFRDGNLITITSLTLI